MGDYEEVFDPILGKNRAKDLFTGSGLLSINGLTPVAQLLAVASAGSDFNIVSSGATHTFNLPTASALNRGALSSTDWSTFNNKLSNISGQDHSTLNNLDYASSGHTGFEKSLTFSTGLSRIGDTISVNPAGINHNNLGGLQGGVAGQYNHLTNAELGKIHDAVTVADTASVDLTLIGQQIKADVLPAGVDHDQLLNYVAGEHFLQSAITQISAGVGDGLVKSTSGTLSTITDNSTNWDTAYGWGDHSVEGYLKNIVEDTTPQLGGDLDTNSNDIKFLDNDKAIFGTGLDFEIYSDGNDAILRQLTQDRDIKFYINDGGLDTKVLTFEAVTPRVYVGDLAGDFVNLQPFTATAVMSIQKDGGNAALNLMPYSGFGNLNTRRTNGSVASPLAVNNNDVLMRFGGGGYDGTAVTGNTAQLDFVATENWNATSHGTRMNFDITLNGGTSRITALSAENNGNITLVQTAGCADCAVAKFEEKDTTPSNPTAGTEVKMYMKDDKIIFQYNDAGTVRYKYLDLTGVGVTWQHSTTAP